MWTYLFYILIIRYNHIYLKNRTAFEIFYVYTFEVCKNKYMNILKVINEYENTHGGILKMRVATRERKI